LRKLGKLALSIPPGRGTYQRINRN